MNLYNDRSQTSNLDSTKAPLLHEPKGVNLESFKQFFTTRYQVLLAIVVLYLLPLSALSLVGSADWGWWSLGLLCMLSCTLLLFVIMRQWENNLAADLKEEYMPSDNQVQLVDVAALNEASEKCRQAEDLLVTSERQKESLEQELTERRDEILSLIKEKERAFKQIDQATREFNQFKEASEEKLEQNNIFLGEYQQTIHEQRSVIEAKQQQIEHLDGKVRDLTYEIKTLLQLAEKSAQVLHPHMAKIDSGSSKESQGLSLAAEDEAIETGDDISQQLKRCIEMAQKITGSSHQGSKQSSRGRELPIDNYALDFRRLCDGLHNESSRAILVFSQKENKLLFVNQQIKELLGWHRDKFSQDFSEIIHDSQEAWHGILSQLAYKNECQAQLSMKTKSGQQVPVNCHVGVIPTGLFRSNIIVVLS